MPAVNYYFSGIGNFSVEQKEELSKLCEYRLQSCHKEYIRQTSDWCYYAAQHKNTVEIMLDSGAFTAWNKGKVIELEPLIAIYGELIEKYEHGLRKVWLINLDKIPGERGRTAGTAEIEEAIVESDKNFEILVKHFGDRVLPVFHQNESKERLHAVCGMADYICVSPRNDVGEKIRISWAAEVHTLLLNETKRIRTHGLATTGMHMLRNVDWFSADSAWWMQTAINGSIFYLAHDGDLRTIQVSEKAGARKDAGQHYSTIPRAMQEIVDARLALHGMTIKQVAEHHTPRFVACIYEVVEWLKSAQAKPLHHAGLFDL